ncbi:immunoglobulin-like domain-containing receptor 1 [Hypomesus transpacificus]|uniref:immunoglobulin-like domain-containing receptor 1 n=1 Tax=Hypomesus transpacificus TaxID=137520 RepID=UPI001F084C0F|nr:immunoglobulin-like domain-containing receptor 1 [Hypomesus transpacificus]
MRLLVAAFLLCFLPTELVCIQVNVPQAERSTMLFASVMLKCDYSTSASLQDILVTWRFKSFCKDPVLEYFSTGYQAALQLGQDPSNDCPDRQRTIRTVVQKRGSQEATLGVEYRQRRISVQNTADLVISEIMWWDHGVYVCSVNAAGDTSGDSDREVKLIVYNWLTVLLIILGALALLLLFCVCCCQCCPQRCCCYVRCPCCPQTCCCPEKAMMQHRMMKDMQKAMKGQYAYGPPSQNSQMNPLLYGGSVSGKSIAMGPMPLPPPQSSAYSMHHPGMRQPSLHGNGSPAGTNQMLDYLENQMRGIDMTSPLLQPQMPPPQHMHQSVPFSAGPPSMLSGLGDGPVERRILQLPPISEQPGRRGPPPGPKSRPPSSSESSRSGYNRQDYQAGGGSRRYPSPTRSRGLPRSYSEESLDGGRSRMGANLASRPRSRSRDDLMDTRRAPSSRGGYSPPSRRRGSWSSEEEDSSSRRGGRGARGRGSVDKPPHYTEYEPGQKPGRNNQRYSDKSSRSGTSIVI